MCAHFKDKLNQHNHYKLSPFQELQIQTNPVLQSAYTRIMKDLIHNDQANYI